MAQRPNNITTVPVKVLTSGSNGACPSESQVANARSELRELIFNSPEKMPTIYSSCNAVPVNSPSDYYWIRSSNGSAVRVYCDFNRQCGCDGPSTWTCVAFLNMSDPNHVCPSNWTTIPYPVRTCGRGLSTSGECSSVFYSTFGLSYRRVCGRIIAYQHGSTEAFHPSVVRNRYRIDGPYVEGVSITHGRVGFRQHVWSFAAALGEIGQFSSKICDCSNTNNWGFSTAFVGHAYFCDSGNHGVSSSTTTFYSNDPLWDGQGCGSSSTCCQFNRPPWFCKTISQSTTDDLEVRICKDYVPHEADTPIQLLELYIQ